jgi:hypothetical protein
VDIADSVYRFSEHMPESDDLTLIVLKGHLLIEEMLERIVKTIVAHGELLDDTKLTFAQKAALARAMCWSQQDSDVWPIIFSINSLRNEFAHQLESPKIETKINRTIELFLNSVEDPESRKGHAAAKRPDQLKMAVVYCMGFLGNYEGEAKFYRGMNDQFATVRESWAKTQSGG